MTKIFFKEWTVKGAYPHFSDFFSEKEFEDSFTKWLEKKSETVTEPHDGFNRKYFSNLFSKTLYYRSNEVLQASFPVWLFEEWKNKNRKLKNETIPSLKEALVEGLGREAYSIYSEDKIPVFKLLDDIEVVRNKIYEDKIANDRDDVKEYFLKQGWSERAAVTLQTICMNSLRIKKVKSRKKVFCTIKPVKRPTP